MKSPLAELPPRSVLIIKPGSLGDVVHALPCVAAIKQAWPQADISWIVDSRWAPLLNGNPCLKAIIEFPRQKFRGMRGLLRGIGWGARLTKLKPDLAVDLQGLLRSALMARGSLARRVVGLGDAREGARWMFDIAAPVDSSDHAVGRCLEALRVLGIEHPATPDFPLPAGEPIDALDSGGPYLVLHPFARGTGKALTGRQIERFCESFTIMRIVLAGVSSGPLRLPPHVVDLTNRTSLAQLVWCLRQARFVVSVDSGPMHIAAAVTNDLFAIHTWSDPRRVGPYNDRAWIWQGGEIRRQDLSPAAPLRPAASFSDADAVRVAEWIAARLAYRPA